jgi:sodium-dependent phosphate cotransporter
MEKKHKLLYNFWRYKKGNYMEFNNPIFQALLGLVIFYIGLKMFSGGMKSMGHLKHLEWFLGNPYWMFAGGIVFTLLWQSSSLTTTAVIGLVASGTLPLPSAIAAILGANVGTTGTIWIAGILVSDGMPQGITKQVALVHTGVNTVMAVALLPFIQPIARFISKF